MAKANQSASSAAQLRALGELYGGGKRRTYLELQRELETGSNALAAASKAWAAFAPRPAALDAAERSAQGLLRLIGELRQQLGGHDAT